MSANSNKFTIEQLEAHGGEVSYDLFYQLITQLQKTRSLEHTNPQLLASLPTSLGEFDVVYILLCDGYKPDLDQDGKRLYAHIIDDDGWTRRWLAGFACLLFPTPRRRRDGSIIQEPSGRPGSAADISIALLPAAQKQGYGRILAQKLVQHAFYKLDIPRVTASVVCPVRPSHSAAAKKQVMYNSKQLCWIFERFGFKFEGITRGAVMGTSVVRGEEPTWHDVYRLSMLQIDHLLSRTFYHGREAMLGRTIAQGPWESITQSPWESMTQRHEEEKHNVESWGKMTRTASVNDACVSEDEGSDDETVSGGDSDSDQDCEMASDFDG